MFAISRAGQTVAGALVLAFSLSLRQLDDFTVWVTGLSQAPSCDSWTACSTSRSVMSAARASAAGFSRTASWLEVRWSRLQGDVRRCPGCPGRSA